MLPMCCCRCLYRGKTTGKKIWKKINVHKQACTKKIQNLDFTQGIEAHVLFYSALTLPRMKTKKSAPHWIWSNTCKQKPKMSTSILIEPLCAGLAAETHDRRREEQQHSGLGAVQFFLSPWRSSTTLQRKSLVLSSHHSLFFNLPKHSVLQRDLLSVSSYCISSSD